MAKLSTAKDLVISEVKIGEIFTHRDDDVEFIKPSVLPFGYGLKGVLDDGMPNGVVWFFRPDAPVRITGKMLKITRKIEILILRGLKELSVRDLIRRF